MWHFREEHTGMFRIGFFPWVCEMKISPAISINKKYHSHQWFLVSSCDGGLPKLVQGILPPPMVTAEELGDARSSHLLLLKVNRETGLAPDSWAAYERNESSETRGLHLPIHRTLHSLTWYLIFDVHIPCPLCCKLVYSLTTPAASLEQFSQSYWDAISPGLQVLSIPTK